ncbi:hypothetical protein C8N25_10216 [Algoriphagus antarcticus]|uniref:Uncharacterized protein n=1 Tax=Algoriphagus antarcticus TaxID=238540 RepID=A0A3E0E314_9BACT|nr:hypothetical protein C8N25_10216 [Algoriphagus antarcticus]
MGCFTQRNPYPNYDSSNLTTIGFCNIAKGNSHKSPEYSEAKFGVLSDRSMIKSAKGTICITKSVKTNYFLLVCVAQNSKSILFKLHFVRLFLGS